MSQSASEKPQYAYGYRNCGRFMNNYLSRKDVIVCGLNAIVYFTQNGMLPVMSLPLLHYKHANEADNQKMVTETKLIDSLHKVIEEFRTDPAVIWRTAVCLRNMATLGRKHLTHCKLFT